MRSTIPGMRGPLLGGILLGVMATACHRSSQARVVILDSSDDAGLERLLREIIAKEWEIDPTSIDMRRPFNQPPLNADASRVGTIAIRVQQRLDFNFTEDEFKQWSNGKSGRGPQEESPEWLLKFTKQALARKRAGQVS